MPPVTNVRFSVVLRHSRSSMAIIAGSPVSRATSAAPLIRYAARTAWPLISSWSRMGTSSSQYVPSYFDSGVACSSAKKWVPRVSTNLRARANQRASPVTFHSFTSASSSSGCPGYPASLPGP